MKTFATSIAEDFGNGGVIDGDLTISGDITVSGSGGMAFSEVLTGDMKITGDVTSGSALYVYSNQNYTGTGNAAFVSLELDHASSSGTVLDIRHDGTGDLLNLRNASTNLMTVTSAGHIKIPSNAELQEAAQGSSGNRIKLKNNSNGDMEFDLENSAYSFYFSKIHGGTGALTATGTDSNFVIDINKSGATGSSTTVSSTGLQIDMDDAATNNASATVNYTGLDIDVDFANQAGISTATGIDINLDNAGANGAETPINHTAIKVQVPAGYHSYNVLQIADDADTGMSYNTADSISISAGANETRFAGSYVQFNGNGGSTSARIMHRVSSATHSVYGFNGGNNYGMGSSGVDVLHLITNSLSRMTIDASGVISASPDADQTFEFGRTKITAKDTDYMYISHYDMSTGNNWAIRQNSSGGTQVNSASGQALNLSINNSAVIGIASTGATVTGILTTTGSSISSMIRTSTETDAVRGSLHLKHTTTGNMVDGFGSSLNFQIRDSAGADNSIAQIHGVRDGADNQGALIFNTAAPGGSITERMRIDVTGDVGIGVTPRNVGSNATLDTKNIYIGVQGALHGSINSDDAIYMNFDANNSNTNSSFNVGTNGSGTGGTILFKIDDNSRISLSNNDGNTSNTVFGKNAFTNNGTVAGDVGADFNVAIGEDAMKAGTLGNAQYNVGVGHSALNYLTTGDYNVAIGAIAASSMVGGSDNVAIGTNALLDSTANKYTVSIGTQALENITDWANDGSIAIGYKAASGKVGSGGQYTTASVHIGFQSAVTQTTGANNTSVGHSTMGGNASGTALTGSDNTVMGYSAGYAMSGAGASNVYIGSNAANSITSGTNNVAIGNLALSSADGGESNNVAIGESAMLSADNGSSEKNIAIGRLALTGGSGALIGNIAIGHKALDATGSNAQTGTIAIGQEALTALTSGSGNIAIGYHALKTEDDGNKCVAIGYEALMTQGGRTGDLMNTAVGYQAAKEIQQSQGIVAIGHLALAGGDSYAGNVAIGNKSMSASQSGAYNVGVGESSLLNVNVNGWRNTAVGHNAGDLTTSGTNNTFLGYEADADAATDSYQVKIGSYGIIKYKTARVTLSDSYTTPAEHDAAHSNSLFNIPSYSYISKITVKVITLSASPSATFSIYKSATLDTASGAALNGDRIELLGANAEDNAGVKVRSQNAQTADSDIVANNGGTVGMVWVSNIDVTVDNSVGWIADANSGVGWGIYIGHGASNNGSDGGADAVLDIMVEYC
ncbi:hypothetical protein [uncultured Mediterranean phage uvMED]|nr:hypothetical protein [uncultured Mediterranean phage uvMED]